MDGRNVAECSNLGNFGALFFQFFGGFSDWNVEWKRKGKRR